MRNQTKFFVGFVGGMVALMLLGASHPGSYSPRPFFFNVEVGTTNGANINLDGAGQILVGANQDIALNNDGSATFAHGAAGFGATGVGNLTTDGGLISTDGGGDLTVVNLMASGITATSAFSSDSNLISSDGSGVLTAKTFNGSGVPGFTGDGSGLTGIPGTAAAHGVVALVSGTNQVSSIYAYSTNAIICTPVVGDATNFTASVSNIVEGVSFTIFASTATTNKVSYAIFP